MVMESRKSALRRRTSLLALVVLVPLAARQAEAQPMSADAEFKRGKALMAEGKLAAACEAFDRSQQLEPNVSTMLNQANCRERNNQLATAHKLFTQAAIQTDRSSDVNTVQLHNVALDRAAKLGARVSIVTLDIPASARVPGLTIKRDGNTIDPATWAGAIELDGGTYAFEASAPGYTPSTVSITVAAEKDRKAFVVPTLVAIETQPVDPTKPAVDPTKPAVDPSKPPTKPPGDPTKPGVEAPTDGAAPSKALAYVVAGGGVALVATGLVFHLLAGSVYDDALAEGNDENQLRLWSKANTRRYIAIGTGFSGIAAIGVGVWLLVRARPEERVTVQPAVATDGASLVVSGWF